ncbi:MAG: hypothetical protein WC732_09050 [Candidatus Omnitrophota bacterium]
MTATKQYITFAGHNDRIYVVDLATPAIAMPVTEASDRPFAWMRGRDGAVSLVGFRGIPRDWYTYRYVLAVWTLKTPCCPVELQSYVISRLTPIAGATVATSGEWLAVLDWSLLHRRYVLRMTEFFGTEQCRTNTVHVGGSQPHARGDTRMRLSIVNDCVYCVTPLCSDSLLSVVNLRRPFEPAQTTLIPGPPGGQPSTHAFLRNGDLMAYVGNDGMHVRRTADGKTADGDWPGSVTGGSTAPTRLVRMCDGSLLCIHDTRTTRWTTIEMAESRRDDRPVAATTVGVGAHYTWRVSCDGALAIRWPVATGLASMTVFAPRTCTAPRELVVPLDAGGNFVAWSKWTGAWVALNTATARPLATIVPSTW